MRWLVCSCLFSIATRAAQPQLEGGALQVGSSSFTVRVSTTAEGALRVTAGARQALPSRIELAAGPPVLSVNDGFTAGQYVVHVDRAGAFTVSASGKPVVRIITERTAANTASAQLAFDGSTTFHGLGQAAPVVALRNERFELVHTPKFGDQTYLYIPFFFSDSGLAVYANAASGDVVALKGGATATLSSATGGLDFYLWGPAPPQQLVSRFYTLSQSQSLLPRWAYGYLQSRFGYHTDDEVRKVVSMFSRQGVPLSAVVLDLYWFRRMGDLEWNREAFPDPRGLAEWLEQQNVKLITISEPFVARDSKSFAAFADAGVLARGADGGVLVFSDWWDFGHAGGSIIDPTSPATARLLGEKYEAQLNDGVDGFWVDLGEPERVPPSATFGRYTEAEYHDFFNLGWVRVVRASFEKVGARPFILSRSGWTGIAGLGVATWSGDVPSTWDGLQAQLPLGLNASMSGLPFWGSDVGGFVTQGGELMPPDPELFLRWQQFGAFMPVDRAHGYGPREPWIYGPEWLARIKRAIALRTSLLPYLYSTAYQVMASGLPMMRPLFFVEPNEPRWRTEEGEFLLGDSVLVAPVLKSIAEQPQKVVRLPAGAWYSALTLERVTGDHEVPVSLDTFPVYFREGAIIPMAIDGAPEAIVLVPGPRASTFTIFTDDGVSEAYRSGAGEKVVVALDAKGVSFSGVTRPREVTLLFPKTFLLPGQGKKAVTLDGPYRAVKVSLKAGATRVAF